MGLAVAALVAVGSFSPLWKRNLRRTPLFTWGMVLAHFGCAVSIAGIAADSAFTQESLTAMQVGETTHVGPFSVTLTDVHDKPGPNYAALAAELDVRKGNGAPVRMTPELHQFTDPVMQTNEAAIGTFWNGQLYLVLGDQAAVVPGKNAIAAIDFKDGKPKLLNVFASWCIPCVAEIPVLMQLKARGVDITGVAIHDSHEQLQQFLAQNGDPYSRIGLDMGGRAQISFGSAGVPETFVVDGKGKIVHQHIGVVTEGDIPVIMAKLQGAL